MTVVKFIFIVSEGRQLIPSLTRFNVRFSMLKFITLLTRGFTPLPPLRKYRIPYSRPFYSLQTKIIYLNMSIRHSTQSGRILVRIC